MSQLFYDYLFINSFYATNEYFLKMFKNNRYFLPNYNEHINQSLWTYCRNVAQFIGKTSLKDDFIVMIVANKNNNLDNPTIVDRCNELIEKCECYVVRRY